MGLLFFLESHPLKTKLKNTREKRMSFSWLSLWNAFRTFDWKAAFPVPDLAIKQINSLLALIQKQ